MPCCGTGLRWERRDTELTNFHRIGLDSRTPSEWSLGVGLVRGDAHAPHRGEAAARRAGCGSAARPDLWGPRGAIPGATRPPLRFLLFTCPEGKATGAGSLGARVSIFGSRVYAVRA